MPSADRDHIKELEDALAALDFAGARAIAHRAEGIVRKELLERVRASRAEATGSAEKLAARIQFLARADHYEGLLALAADPATERLLTLLSVELHRGAKLHLDGAERRQARFRASARRHMKAAAEALVLLDIAKASTELDKVEARWLTDTQRAELSALRRQTDQASAERLEIENRTAAVLREHAPDLGDRSPDPAADSKGQRRLGRSGCLGSALLAVALLAAAVLAMLN